jgi:hypothetical protein
LQGGSFEELSCFTPNQTIDGDGKRGEVLALFETGLQVLLIFLALLRGQDFVASISVIMSLGHSSVTFLEEYVTL